MLSTGTRLGPYELQSALGTGGMGAVYKARDTRLERTVAIKVLSGGPISTAELRQRFEREAKAISALHHPHICVLYDIGSQDGIDYLVMEYVEGETLADRLKRGALPIQQVLKMGMEIADALDKAHRSGLVHRDIKPANIMLTRGGAKLLDFGLAKSAGVATPSTIRPADVSALTAMTSLSQGQPLTQEGMIVGTYQYMAPEQIEAGVTDGRTDLFALGCVLYEAATGRTAFSGKTQASVIAAILASEPPAMSSVQPLTPPLLERAIRACLAKDPEDRIHSAHDLKLQLGWALDSGEDTQSLSLARSRSGVPWLAVAGTALVVAAAAVVGTLAYLRSHETKQVIRAAVDAGDGVNLPLVHSMALSPDGKMLAYVAQSGNEKPTLWVRPLSAARARRVEDTDNASYPFWSPDSRSVAFFVPGKLKRLDTVGWSVENICDAEDGRGGAWNDKGTIVFAPASTGGLMRVSAAGGLPAALTNVSDQVTTHRWPQFLPDGNTVFYLSIKSNETEGELWRVNIGDGKATQVRSAGANDLYLDGRLLFMRGSALVAQPVKGASLEPAGDPETLAENVGFDSDRWAADYTASENGLLVYRSDIGNELFQLAEMDVKTGKVVASVGDPGPYSAPRVSPDGSKIAVLMRTPRAENLVLGIVDAARGVVTPLLIGNARTRINGFAWMPDNKTIVFAANLADRNRSDLYIKAVNGTEQEQPLLKMDSDLYPSLITEDGRFVLFVKSGGKATHNDIWMLPFSGDHKPVPLLATAADEMLVGISKDDRWMLYTSDETGRRELYVTTFPIPHGRWQVSNAGANGGAFDAAGTRLAMVDGDGKVFEVPFDGRGAEPKLGKPEPVLGGVSINTFGGATITPDWKHLIVAKRQQAGAPRITLITNWIEETKR